MFVQVTCANCKQTFKAGEELFGAAVKCPQCRAALAIPDPRAQAPAPDPMVGRQVAHYRIESLLGQGGMGKVYRAKNLTLNKTCALKVLPEHFAKQNKTFVDRFIREAQSAANVEHPNVLPVYFVGKAGDTYFIEMQYVDGGTLDKRLEDRGRLDPMEAARIVRDVAAGLASAHAKGIIHRDVKPSNVMLTKDGQIKVADFGLARMGQMTTKLTLSGMIMGTPLYMSPEQAQGQPVDHRSDIYSLGVMLYQLLTGTPPYTADTPLPLLNKHVNEPIPDILQVLPELPPDLAAIVTRLMAKRPEDRYQNCTEVVTDLDALLAAPGAPAQISVATRTKAAELRKPVEAERRGRRKGLLVAMGMVAIAAAVGIGILIGQLRRRPAPRPPRNSGAHLTRPADDVRKPAESNKTRHLQIAKADRSPVGVSPEKGLTADSEAAPVSASKPTAEAAAPTKAELANEEVMAKARQATAPKETRTELARARKAEAPAEKAKGIDLARFTVDAKPVNALIAEARYADARARAVLLAKDYPGPVATKLANLDRIIALRKRCFDRVNSGKAKLSMGDISRRYAFAGEIVKADETGLTGKIVKKWAAFSADELQAFYEKASDPNSADDLLGLAAFLMEGDVDAARLEGALVSLAKAREKGANVTSLLEYVEMLKRVRGTTAPTNPPEETERGQKQESADVARSSSATSSASSDSRQTTSATASRMRNDSYVAKADTGDEIPHPLSRKTYVTRDKGKRIEVPEGMLLVPAGKFPMGRNENRNETGLIQKDVQLDAYFIDKYEVTNAQYRAFVEATGRRPPAHWQEGKIPEGRENHPVVNVSWEDAKAYCDWCGKRLPTEAEWEKAAGWDAKKKEKREYPWGDRYEPSRANHCYQLGCRCNGRVDDHNNWMSKWTSSETGNATILRGGNTAPVGKFGGDVSPSGCMDMAGNVAEWVADWYRTDYYRVGPNKNPPGPTAEEATVSSNIPRARVLRGSFWCYCSPPMQTAHRHRNDPSASHYGVGFRCAADCPWKPPGE